MGSIYFGKASNFSTSYFFGAKNHPRNDYLLSYKKNHTEIGAFISELLQTNRHTKH